MEDSNYWGYGYKTQHSYPRSQLITWRRPEVKFGRNVVKKKQHKNYQDEDKKSAINKKLILWTKEDMNSTPYKGCQKSKVIVWKEECTDTTLWINQK